MSRDEDAAPERETLHILSELEEHEEELARLLREVRTRADVWRLSCGVYKRRSRRTSRIQIGCIELAPKAGRPVALVVQPAPPSGGPALPGWRQSDTVVKRRTA